MTANLRVMVLVGVPARWPGCRLLDVHGARVGTIVRVRGDDGDPRPSWIVADLGRLTPCLVAVPAADAIGWSGQVTVPYSRATIRLAPRLWRPDDAIGARAAEHLRRHYGVAGDLAVA